MCMAILQADLGNSQSKGLGFGQNPGIAYDSASVGQSQGVAGVSLLPLDRVVPAITDTYLADSGQHLPVCMHFGGGPLGYSPLTISSFPVQSLSTILRELAACNLGSFQSRQGSIHVRAKGRLSSSVARCCS